MSRHTIHNSTYSSFKKYLKVTLFRTVRKTKEVLTEDADQCKLTRTINKIIT